MNEKLELLNKATDAYNEGHPIMSDEEWDNLYFELGEQAQNIRYEVEKRDYTFGGIIVVLVL